MMWKRIDNYYSIRTYLGALKPGKSHCGICYKTTCDHNVERISYIDARDQLNTWSEIALQEYPGRYLEIGEVAIYPSWPINQHFDDKFIYHPYRVFPKIKDGVFGGIVAHDNVIGYNPDFTENSYLTDIGRRVARFGRGCYWGYGWQDNFYVMRLFRQNWQEIRRKSLPHKDVVGLSVPDYGSECPFEVIGYHFIPLHTNSNYDFQTKYFEI